MPATRATASTSPLVIAPAAIALDVSGCIITRQRATARRCDDSFAVTSTIRARPSGSRWVNCDGAIARSVGPTGAYFGGTEQGAVAVHSAGLTGANTPSGLATPGTSHTWSIQML